jgi:hypothetical protein
VASRSRSRRWTRERLWERVLEALRRDLYAAREFNLDLLCIDGAYVREH